MLISADVTADHLANVVRDIAAVSVDDGMAFDLDTISVQITQSLHRPALGCSLPRHG